MTKARLTKDTKNLFDNRNPTLKQQSASGVRACKSLAEPGRFVHAA